MIFDICCSIGWFAMCGYVIYTLWLLRQGTCIDGDAFSPGKYIEYYMNGRSCREEVSRILHIDGDTIAFVTTDGLEVVVHCSEWRYIVKDGDEP